MKIRSISFFKLCFTFLLLISISVFQPTNLFAQCSAAYPNVPSTNGIVTAFAYDAQTNRIYFGGSFTAINPYFNQATTLDSITGVENTNYPAINGAVNIAIPDGNGGLYIGGAFTTVGGLTRNRIAHIYASGQVSSWNPNAGAAVSALVLSGTSIYVAGSFTTIGGQTRNRIAQIDTTTGLASTWNPNASAAITSLAVTATSVYAGGTFTSIGGQARNRIAELDITTGLATAWNPNSDGAVNAILVSGTDVFIGGAFSNVSALARKRIAKIDITTGVASSWNPNGNGNVNCMILQGSSLYIGGAFTTIGGQTRNRLAVIDITTGLAGTFNPNAASTVNAMILSGTTLYVTGAFTTIGGQTRNRVASVNIVTNAINSFTNTLNGNGNTIAIAGGSIFIGGAFTAIGGVIRNRIAAIDATTGVLSSWNPNADNSINSIVISGATVYVGGAFANIGGQLRNRLAGLNNSTGLANTWNPNANNIVIYMALSGSTIYVAGAFTKIGVTTRNRIASLSTSSNTPNTWDPNANSTVISIATSGQNVYLGGAFTTIGGQTRNRIAAIDATTGLATSWDPNADGNVNAITVLNNKVFVGGAFLNIGGLARNRIASLNSSNGLATSWNPNANNILYALSTFQNKIYAGGSFTSIGGQTRNRIAALDSTTALASTWNPNLAGIAYSIALSPSTIYVGGAFQKVANNNAYEYLAGFNLQPVFTLNPVNTTICELADTSFNVTSPTATNFQWQVDKGFGFINVVDNAIYSNSNTSSLRIADAIIGMDGYKYQCVVTDACSQSSTSQSSTLTVNALPISLITPAASTALCQGDSVLLNASTGLGLTFQWLLNGFNIPSANDSSVYVSAAGDYSVTVTSANSCARTSTTETVTVLPISTSAQAITVCNGDTYTIGSNTYVSSGVYTDLFSAANGCDSTVTTTLTVLPLNNFVYNPALCAGGSVNVGTSTYTVTGTYTDILTDSHGCDSTVTTNLTVTDTIRLNHSFNLCAGESITIGLNTYTTDGVYVDTLLAAAGCDSIVTTTLAFHPVYSITVDTTICSNQSYIVGTNTYTVQATYVDTIATFFGCDSVITTNLTVLHSGTYPQTIINCAGDVLIVGSSNYSLTGSYTDVFTAANGCDSIITTNLTVLPLDTATNTVVVCNGQSVNVGSNIYSASGNYSDTLTNVNGCDSIITTNLIVLPLNTFTQTLSACNGQVVTVGSSAYSATGNYSDFFTDINGCDSTVFTNLTVFPANNVTQNVTLCSGQTLAVDTNVYSVSGTYVDVLVDINGCDSTLTTILTIANQINVSQSVAFCPGDSIVVGSHTYNTAGNYIDSVSAIIGGCDSIIATTVSIFQGYSINNPISICQGQSYSIGINTYSAAGTFSDTLATINGCDSIIVTQLTVTPTYSVNNTQSICPGGSYSINGNIYTLAGTYNDTLTSISGCDSVIITGLTINPVYIVANLQTICSNEVYSINGNVYTLSGTYNDTLSTVMGCDSIIVTDLTVNQSYSVNNPQTICQGGSYNFNGNTYAVAGNFNDTLYTTLGCDSIIVTQLTVNPNYSINNSQSVCPGGSYSINGNTYTIAGIYNDTLSTTLGCDSIIVTDLTINPVYSINNTQSICPNGAYTINGNTYTVAGTYNDTLTTVMGCDSIIVTDLTINPVYNVNNPQTICANGFYTINGNNYNLPGTYSDTLATIMGCDSIIVTDLTVNPFYTTNNPQVICQGDSYVFNGNTYGTAGNFNDTLTTILGCDSIIVTQLTVNPSYSINNPQAVCPGGSYVINGNIYTVANTYSDTLTTALGCDSIIVTNLTILPYQTANNLQTICAGGSYAFNGNVYSVAGNYNDTIPSVIGGCDSVVITQITIAPYLTSNNPQVICPSGSYTFNGNTYTIAGNYNDTLTTGGGCDSIVVTQLSIATVVTVNNPQSVCPGGSYVINGNTYTITGTYNDTLTSLVSGCDSIVVTTLTINPVYSVANPQTICQGVTYTINGNTYSVSGIFNDTLSTINGCDSIIVTDLTVLPSSSFSQTKTICFGQSITVGTTTHSATGVFVDVLTAANGCDSTVTTNLTVRSANTFSQALSVCAGQSVTVGTVVHNVTGVFVDVLVAANGCDSTVTTNLIVMPANLTNVSNAICVGQSITVGTHTYNSTGVYTDVFIAANGCDSTIITTLTVNVLPTIVANASAALVCDGSNLTLTGSGGATYTWSNNVVDGQAFVFNASTTYSLVGTDANGCTNVASIVVTLATRPVVNIGADVAIDYGATYNLEPAVQNGTSYSWSPADWITSSTVLNPSITPEAATDYVLTVTSADGCVNSDTIKITLKGELVIANYMSPNGDGDNDTWKVSAPFLIKTYAVQIVDSWGNLVFEKAQGYNNEWDGTSKGKNVADGAYYYQITDNGKAVYRGSITLTR